LTTTTFCAKFPNNGIGNFTDAVAVANLLMNEVLITILLELTPKLQSLGVFLFTTE